MNTATTANVTQVLNKQVANWTLLFTKLHNYHWYVKGNLFFTLHAKFEELYNEAAANIDELAERLLSIGGKPAATLKECLGLSSLKEASGAESAAQMVETLVEDFGILLGELKEGMAAAQETGDEATSDMLLSIHGALEKHRWMLRSFLS